MTYRAEALAISVASQRSLATLWASFEADRITRDEFVTLAAGVLASYNARAATVADVALAVDLARMGIDAAPTGVTSDDGPRLELAFATLLARQESPTVEGALSVARIAGAEPLRSAQLAYGQAMVSQGVPYWTRVTRAGACKICRDLTGPELPVSVTMYHHPGCACYQQPIVRTRARPA